MSGPSSDLQPFIARVADGQALGEDDATAAFEIIMSGDATPSQIGGFLMALRTRGETVEELHRTMRDIRDAGVEVLTIGQYLQPTREHLPVDRFVHPDEFADYKRHALELGFAHCESGPLVRSSYHAHEHVPEARPAGAR